MGSTRRVDGNDLDMPLEGGSAKVEIRLRRLPHRESKTGGSEAQFWAGADRSRGPSRASECEIRHFQRHNSAIALESLKTSKHSSAGNNFVENARLAPPPL